MQKKKTVIFRGKGPKYSATEAECFDRVNSHIYGNALDLPTSFWYLSVLTTAIVRLSDGRVDTASASKSVDSGSDSRVGSYQRFQKIGIQNFRGCEAVAQFLMDFAETKPGSLHVVNLTLI